MAKLELISYKLCPYVQRAAIALEEKGVDYSIRYIDLANKPQWFLDLSPTGKVPVLKVDDTVLFESAIIAEYLDDVYEPKLLPADPLHRAQQKAETALLGGLAAMSYRMLTGKDEDSVRSEAKGANALLARLERQIQGPYITGETFQLIDASIAPMLQHLWWLEEAGGLGIFEGRPAVVALAEAYQARPSVQRSLVDDARLLYRDALRTHSWVGTQLA